MILEGICMIFFGLAHGILLLLPTGWTMPDWGTHAANLIAKAMIIFPADVWAVFIGNVSFWLIAQMAWAIIEWCYKKIPGVD